MCGSSEMGRRFARWLAYWFRSRRALSVTATSTHGLCVETIHAFPSHHLHNLRDLTVYLPDDYDREPQRAYPVLYANDGQDLRAMNVEHTLADLYAANAIQRVIVIGIYATTDRMQEYGTTGVAGPHGLGRRADAYARFVLEEVRPYINAHYRAHTAPAHTALMGWSLGGLSTFDLAWEHTGVFRTVGAFSGSFWWRSEDGDLARRLASRVAHRKVREGRLCPGLRFWFEAGTKDETDDRDHNGVIDSIQDTLELMDELRAKGYRAEADMTYLQVEGGEHNPATWAAALPHFLKWAFPVGK
jgi:enterochelin esterase family protein